MPRLAQLLFKDDAVVGIAHAVERVQGGGSLRLLLGRTRAATAADAVHERDGGEDGLVCRARRVARLKPIYLTSPIWFYYLIHISASVGSGISGADGRV